MILTWESPWEQVRLEECVLQPIMQLDDDVL